MDIPKLGKSFSFGVPDPHPLSNVVKFAMESQPSAVHILLEITVALVISTAQPVVRLTTLYTACQSVMSA